MDSVVTESQRGRLHLVGWWWCAVSRASGEPCSEAVGVVDLGVTMVPRSLPLDLVVFLIMQWASN
jgi:hypothetical protein